MKIHAKLRFITIIILIGFSLVTCDNGTGSSGGNHNSGNNNNGGTSTSLNGTYYEEGFEERSLTFNNGNFSESYYGYVIGIGTYTVSGNKITLTYKQSRAFFASESIDGQLNYIYLSDFYSTKEQCITALEKFYKFLAEIGKITTEDANEWLAEIAEEDFIMSLTGSYSLNGNLLIITFDNEYGQLTLIKK